MVTLMKECGVFNVTTLNTSSVFLYENKLPNVIKYKLEWSL
jgi:hypothetical protein